MSGWHKASCQVPDVFVNDGGLPHCRACESTSPTIDEHKALLGSNAGSTSQPPKDPEPGKMNLRWPPSVRYLRDDGSSSYSSVAQTAVQDEKRSEGEIGTDSLSSSTIYHSLGRDEFRLLCLEAVDETSDLVHVELKTYCLDDCPDYETTSYTWGGEDGNSNLSNPVYFGRYWDVLL